MSAGAATGPGFTSGDAMAQRDSDMACASPWPMLRCASNCRLLLPAAAKLSSCAPPSGSASGPPHANRRKSIACRRLPQAPRPLGMGTGGNAVASCAGGRPLLPGAATKPIAAALWTA